MGTFANARAVYGLHATGTPAGTNVSGTVTVGATQTETEFADGDVAYSFMVTSTGASDVATLTLSSGAVAQTTGTPTIVDGDGNDFEGVALPTMATVHAILLEVVDNGTSISVTSSNTELPDIPSLAGTADAIRFLMTLPSGVQSALGTIAFGFSASGDAIKVTVLAQSS